MLEKVDTNNRGFLCLWAANRWLSICCDCSGSLVALFAGAFVLLNPAIDAGVAGLSLSCTSLLASCSRRRSRSGLRLTNAAALFRCHHVHRLRPLGSIAPSLPPPSGACVAGLTR